MRRTIRHTDVIITVDPTSGPTELDVPALRNLKIDLANKKAATITLPKDTYGDKLVRYIPAEVLGFYILAYPFMKEQGEAWRAVVLVISLLGLFGWLIVRARAEQLKPGWWYYLLSAIAFLAWAIGTSTVGSDLFGLTEQIGQFTVMVAVFLVPLIDELLSPRKTKNDRTSDKTP